MPRMLACLSLIAVSCTVAFGQPAAPAAKFLMADVHTVPPPTQFGGLRVGLYKGGRYEIHTATMLDLVRTAYGVDPDKVLGIPPALARNFFEVVATTPPGVTPDTLKLMLQDLLAERFSLVAHRDTKPVPAYVITAGPKPLLKEADGTGETGCKIQSNDTSESTAPRPGVNIVRTNINGSAVQLDLNKPFPFACRNMTMAAFAETLRTLLGAQQYILNTQVVDQTELKGKWNFEVSWTFRQGPQAPVPAAAVTIFDAFDKLGLKLELGKAPFPVIVVDSVTENPTANLPGVTEKLAPPPARFELADLRPGIPVPNSGGGNNGGPGGLFMQGGGRVTLLGQSLKSLIATAWNLNNAGSVIGGPPSLEKAKFDVDALAPVPEPVPGFGPMMGQNDIDGLRQMLRTLLQERFKLTVHEEQRPVPGEEFTVSNPDLLKKADPAGRTGCTEGPGRDGKDPRTSNPKANRLLTCLNMTVAEFAIQLKNQASGYLGQSPVPVDATKLEGKYDFTLNFSGAGLTGPGTITLSEALDKQVGLKLGMGNHPGKALVIDHCEEQPIDE